MRIAYQGEPGAYSEAAALRFSDHADLLACESFDDVFRAVATGRATHGILPVENSIGGSIHRNYDLLIEHDLPIVGEVELPIRHHLLALPGTAVEQVKRIYSHPQALAQCERFLRELPDVRVHATYDTAGSAKLIKEQALAEAAAIASERAAQVFGLDVLRSDIQDYSDNITRFLLISRITEPDAPADKTTVVFSLSNAPGALFKALSVFALRDIDLTKIESRPIRGRPWEYLFYVDIPVSRQDLRCARALVHLAEFARSVRTLGSYPSWKSREQRVGEGQQA
jgi:prephenate dehydratase